MAVWQARASTGSAFSFVAAPVRRTMNRRRLMFCRVSLTRESMMSLISRRSALPRPSPSTIGMYISRLNCSSGMTCMRMSTCMRTSASKEFSIVA